MIVWIDLKIWLKRLIETRVVFEFGATGLRYNPFNRLIETRVVFEF